MFFYKNLLVTGQFKKKVDIQIKPGKSFWMERCDFTKKEIYPVNILIYRKKNEPEPWYKLQIFRKLR